MGRSRCVVEGGALLRRHPWYQISKEKKKMIQEEIMEPTGRALYLIPYNLRIGVGYSLQITLQCGTSQHNAHGHCVPPGRRRPIPTSFVY